MAQTRCSVYGFSFRLLSSNNSPAEPPQPSAGRIVCSHSAPPHQRTTESVKQASFSLNVSWVWEVRANTVFEMAAF